MVSSESETRSEFRSSDTAGGGGGRLQDTFMENNYIPAGANYYS